VRYVAEPFVNQHRVHRFDDFEVDAERWRLSRGGQEIHLEPVVLKLLIYLIANRDRLVTRQELMDTVWGDTVISESALTKAVARLRKALDDDSATPHYLETVRSQGYRFIAAVEEIERPDHHGLPSADTGQRTVRRGLFAGAAAVVLVIIMLVPLVVHWMSDAPKDASQSDMIRSLAVLPLNNLTGDSSQDYYVDGLQDILITELSQVPGLRVTSRQSTVRYRGSRLPTADIAGQLGVDALVEGSLLREGNDIELTIQLIHGRSDEHIWAARYTRETRDVFNLLSDVAQAIESQIVPAAGAPGNPGRARERDSRVDARAIDSYSVGLMHLDRYTPEDVQSAVAQFEKAVEIDPRFTLAWGHLVTANMLLGLYGYIPPSESIERSRAAALKAIEADDRSYIGYSALGWVLAWSGDFEGGCESIEQALRLNPSDPLTIHGDADCMLLDGRMEESIARMRDIEKVAPFNAVHGRALPYHLFLSRRYDEAIAEVAATRARIPVVSMHYILAWVYWVQGDLERALEAERLELERRGDTVLLEALEEGLDAAGPVGAMRAMAEALVARAERSYVDPFEIGKTFARAGMVDEALYWLERAVDYGSYETTYLVFRPDFDVLRDDPRYQELLQRVYGDRVPQIKP
jgi:TolB-like protein/DNA-binding winged helix-turn-helix (wHTH) protein/tetratricopeptide (TPR) repeat protein